MGKRIAEARKKKGLTQAQFAVAIGIAQSALSQIEAGRTEPRKATLQQIAQTLENDLGEIALRQFLDERPVNTLQNVIERLCAMVNDNEYLLMSVVVTLADKLPAFARFIEPKTLADLRAKNKDLREMMDLMGKGDTSWGEYLEPLGFLDGLDEEDVQIEPAEMILAPVVARIGPGKKAADPKEEIRQTLVSEEGIEEMKRRLKPKKRKTG